MASVHPAQLPHVDPRKLSVDSGQAKTRLKMLSSCWPFCSCILIFFFWHISIPCTWACSYTLDCRTSFDFYRVDCVSTSSEAFLYCKIHYSLFIYYLFIYYLLNNNGIIAWHQDKVWIEVLLVHVIQKAFCLIKILYLYRLFAIYHSILI